MAFRWWADDVSRLHADWNGALNSDEAVKQPTVSLHTFVICSTNFDHCWRGIISLCRY